MSAPATDAVRAAAQVIVDGDESMTAARRLELLLIDNFLDTALWDRLTYTLAMYDPVDTEYDYCGPDEMRAVLREVLENLDALASQASEE